MLYPTTCVGLRYGRHEHVLSGFSREYDYPRYRAAPGGGPYFRLSARRACFTARLGAYRLQRAIRMRAEVPLLRRRVAERGGHGMLTVRPSASPFGLALGTD